MRVVIVWSTAIVLLLSISIGWYMSLPVCFALSSSIESEVTGAGLTALRIVEYVVILWGPLWCGFIVLWAFMESHGVDIQGATYSG